MKAISTIIALILILIVVIAIIALLLSFLLGLFTNVQQSGTESTIHTAETFFSCISIDSIYGNKIYLRNCGKGTINGDLLRLYFSDAPYNFIMTPSTINRGEVATVKLLFFDLAYGTYNMKITGPSAQLTKAVEVYPSTDSSLVLDARFNEGSGKKTLDFSGKSNNIEINGPVWVEGKYGNAIRFNGVSDDVGVNDSQSIRIGGNIQVDAWIKTSSTGSYTMAIADRYSGDVQGQEQGWLLFLSSQGRLTFHVGGSGGVAEVAGVKNLRDDRWHYVVGSYNGSAIKVLVDGVIEGPEISYSGSIWNETAEPDKYGLSIGVKKDCGCGGSTSSYFNGVIDEVKIYSDTEYLFKTMFIKVSEVG